MPPTRATKLLMMVMPACAMHVAVLNFFLGSGAYAGHLALETQALARPRVITVHYDLAIRDVGNGVEDDFAALVFAFELHANFQVF